MASLCSSLRLRVLRRRRFLLGSVLRQRWRAHCDRRSQQQTRAKLHPAKRSLHASLSTTIAVSGDSGPVVILGHQNQAPRVCPEMTYLTSVCRSHRCLTCADPAELTRPLQRRARYSPRATPRRAWQSRAPAAAGPAPVRPQRVTLLDRRLPAAEGRWPRGEHRWQRHSLLRALRP
jgi:hypothetical protein